MEKSFFDLRAFRKSNGLTGARLGEILGVSSAFISRVESKKDSMPDTWPELLRKAGYDVDSFYIGPDIQINSSVASTIIGSAKATTIDPRIFEIMEAELATSRKQLEAAQKQIEQLAALLTSSTKINEWLQKQLDRYEKRI